MNYTGLVSFAALAFSPALLFSQGTQDPQKPVPQVCVIPVGAPAANIAEWKSESVFSFKPTDPGATPPMDLFYQKITKDGRAYEPLPFSLGMPTAFIKAPQSSLTLYKQSGTGKEATYAPGFQLPVGNSPLTAVVMWRDKKKPDWKEPNILAVDASLEAWPPGQVRFVNLSPAVIGLTLREGQFKLEPQSSHSATVAAGTPFPYRLDAAVNGQAVFISSTAVSMSVPTRTLVAVYGSQKGTAEVLSVDIPVPVVDPPPTTGTTASGGAPTDGGKAGKGS